MPDLATPNLLTFTAQIVAAHVAGNKVTADDMPALINDVYGTLARVDAPIVVAPAQEPAVPIKRSIQHDYLVCLEDGAKLRILTRYLQRFGLTPDTYRAKWGLAQDYPMMAPTYAARRSALAKQFGLGAALSTARQSAPEVPHLPIAVEQPTVPVSKPEHTAASVFAKFPSDEAPVATKATEKPGRKRLAQQSTRVGRRRSATD